MSLNPNQPIWTEFFSIMTTTYSTKCINGLGRRMTTPDCFSLFCGEKLRGNCMAHATQRMSLDGNTDSVFFHSSIPLTTCLFVNYGALLASGFWLLPCPHLPHDVYIYIFCVFFFLICWDFFWWKLRGRCIIGFRVRHMQVGTVFGCGRR